MFYSAALFYSAAFFYSAAVVAVAAAAAAAAVEGAVEEAAYDNCMLLQTRKEEGIHVYFG